MKGFQVFDLTCISRKTWHAGLKAIQLDTAPFGYRPPILRNTPFFEIRKPHKMKGRKFRRLPAFFQEVVRICNRYSTVESLAYSSNRHWNEYRLYVCIKDPGAWAKIIPHLKPLAEERYPDKHIRFRLTEEKVYSMNVSRDKKRAWIDL